MAQVLIEHSECVLVEEVGVTGGKRIRVRGEFGRVDVPTANKRRYPRGVMEAKVAALQESLRERKVLGELDHPGNGVGSLFRVSHVLTALEVGDDGIIRGTAEVLNTPPGLILQELIKAKIPVGVSSRGTGSVKQVEDGMYEVQDDYVLNTFDFVIDPAMRTAYPEVVSEMVERVEGDVAGTLSVDRLYEYVNGLPEEVRSGFLEKVVSGLGEDSSLLEGIRVRVRGEVLALQEKERVAYEDGLKEEVKKEVGERVLERERAIRAEVEGMYASDPRYGLARKFMEMLAEQYAPLVMGAESVALREAQERVTAHRDMALRQEYSAACLRAKVEELRLENERMRVLVVLHERTCGHPKGNIIRELVGIHSTMEKMEERLKVILGMKEFGSCEEAIEGMVSERVLGRLHEEVHAQVARVREQYEGRVEALGKEIEGLREEARRIGGVEGEVEDLRNRLRVAVEAGKGLIGERDSARAKVEEMKGRHEQEARRLEEACAVLTARMDGYRQIMTRADRTALSEQMDRATTVDGVESVLKNSRKVLSEGVGLSSGPPKGRAQVVEERGKNGNGSVVEDVDVVGLDFEEYTKMVGR